MTNLTAQTKLKHLRDKKREYRKHRTSTKYKELNIQYQKEISAAKNSYYKNIIKDLKHSKPNQWYSKLKRLCSYDQHKSEPIIVDSIKELSDSDQAEAIADKFAKISQEYEPLKKDDIVVPAFEESTIPKVLPQQVQKHLRKLKVNKSVPPGDIPPKLAKLFAAQISIPLCNIINTLR